jgi:two-component system, LuxR family, response regulator FixJ
VFDPAKPAEHWVSNGATVAVNLDQKPADRRGQPVFVVDDDASVRESLSVLLETFGFAVVTHASGSQMLTDERRRNTGCVIVDHQMPGMDGLQMLSALYGQGIKAPAILITGRLDAAITARATSIGVRAILEKPFPTMRLVELVRLSLEESK